MKKLLFVFIVTSLLYGCKKQETAQPIAAKGSVTIAVSIDGRIVIKESSLKSDVQSFKVSIYSLAGTVVKSYDKLSDVPTDIELDEGQYYAVAQSVINTKPEFEIPYYYGQSDVFTITKGTKQSVSVACIINNVKIQVSYDANVTSTFSNWQTVIYSKSDSLVFGQTETRAGYVNPGTIQIKSTLTYTSLQGIKTQKVIIGNIASASGGKQYNIVISASLSNGKAGISVSANDALPIETITLTDSSQTSTSGGTSSSGTTTEGLLITEIMPDPSKVSDDLGEWIELYNASNASISLQGKTLKQGTLSIKFSESLSIAAKSSFVLGKSSDIAVNGGVTVQYVYSGFGLPNTGTKTIQLIDTDGVTVLAEMTYSATTSGKSIALIKDKYTASAAKLETSWSTATKQYGAGDYGSPGAINE